MHAGLKCNVLYVNKILIQKEITFLLDETSEMSHIIKNVSSFSCHWLWRGKIFKIKLRRIHTKYPGN